jgi:hypothetical protein
MLVRLTPPDLTKKIVTKEGCTPTVVHRMELVTALVRGYDFLMNFLWMILILLKLDRLTNL